MLLIHSGVPVSQDLPEVQTMLCPFPTHPPPLIPNLQYIDRAWVIVPLIKLLVQPAAYSVVPPSSLPPLPQLPPLLPTQIVGYVHKENVCTIDAVGCMAYILSTV